MTTSRCGSNRQDRRGVAVVELAVCMPVLVLITMIAIQASDLLFLKQTLHISAYESMRVAIRNDATTSDAKAAGDNILNLRNVNAGRIIFTPLDVSSAARGETISVTVTAPSDANSVLPYWLYQGKLVRATASMVKE